MWPGKAWISPELSGPIRIAPAFILSNSLFRLAPYVVFGTMVAAAAIIPSMGTGLPLSMAADSIALVGLLATARVFLSLAAMDVGTAFGTLGVGAEAACLHDGEPEITRYQKRLDDAVGKRCFWRGIL